MKDLTITSVIKVYEYDELNDADRALLDDAIEATRRSYAPYSHFSVVSGPGSEDSCHRRTYGKRLYRHSDSSLRRLSPGDSGNGKKI